MTTSIIYHDNCPDGFTAYWWLRRTLEIHDPSEEIIGIPASYSKDFVLSNLVHHKVYMVDIFLDAPSMLAIRFMADSCLVLDHHQTALELSKSSNFDRWAMWNNIDEAIYELAGSSDKPGNFNIVLDMNYSGAGLVAEWCGREYPQFIDHVEDRDLWKFKLADTKPVFAAVTSRAYDLATWDIIATTNIDDLIREGEGIERYRQQVVKSIAETAYVKRILGYEVWCVTAPYALGSDVAGYLAAKHPETPFAAYYVDYGDRHKYGLRSRPDGADVAVLAQMLGGGGHKHASGFEIEFQLDEIVDPHPF